MSANKILTTSQDKIHRVFCIPTRFSSDRACARLSIALEVGFFATRGPQGQMSRPGVGINEPPEPASGKIAQNLFARHIGANRGGK